MYWDNSIFLTNKQKEKLEREVDYICNEVKNIMLDNGLCVSLYLSGSLARREPTCICVQGEVKISSDFDFVVIYDKVIHSYKSINMVISKIKRKFNSYDCSFATIEIEKLKYTSSFFKRDLMLNSCCPLYRELEINKDSWGECKIEMNNYVESIITQACCYFLNTSLTKDKSNNYFFKDAGYHKVKLILECFRAYAFACGESIVGYNDLILSNINFELLENYPRGIVNKCIQARELSMYEKVSDFNILQLIDITFMKLFSSEEYSKKICEELSHLESPIIIFQNISILLLLSFYNKYRWEDLYKQLDYIKIGRASCRERV